MPPPFHPNATQSEAVRRITSRIPHLSPRRELLVDPPETLEIAVAPFVVSFLQLRAPCSVWIHGRTADLVLPALVITIEVRHHLRSR